MKNRFNKLSAGLRKRNDLIVLHSASRKWLSIEKLGLSVAYIMRFRKKDEYFTGDSELIWTRVAFWIVTEIQLFEYPDPTPLHFCLWGWMISEVYERKVDTQHELLICILDAAASIKKVEDRLQQHSIFAQKLQSALWMTVGFSNIYCEAQQIYHFCVTNLSLKHKTTVKSKINFSVK